MRYKIILRRLILIFIGVTVGLGIYFANASGFIGNRLPMPFGYGAAVVLSESMEPTYSKGDLLFIEETQSLAVGDVVVYQCGGEHIVHRVIKLEGDLITTQGDANNVSDPLFEISAVEGKVVGCIPFVGELANLIKTPVGIFVLIASAILLIELSFRGQKNNDEKELDVIRTEIERLKQNNNVDKLSD